jgi:hypothetical protein
MDKRYQVFVSSTYADLKDERQKVIQTLMEMDCIPSGMELFPASDEEQFDFIKRIIDDCDYYLLIIGGRYGSTTAEGISFTEKEFDYAISKGLKIIAFLHGDPQAISVGKTDNNPELAERLTTFREKAQTSRLVKYWQKPEELPGMVALSLSKTIKTYPAVGWIRATSAGSTELLEEINALRKENAALRVLTESNQSSDSVDGRRLVNMNEAVTLYGSYRASAQSTSSWRDWNHTLSWADLFALIAPDLMSNPSDGLVEITLRKEVLKIAGVNFYEIKIDHQIYSTVKIQLQAYGLVKIQNLGKVGGGTALFWSLTERGQAEMIRLRAIRVNAENP